MTHQGKVLEYLSDGQWHTVNELCQIYYKFGARIFDLRRKGFPIESKRNPEKPHEFIYQLKGEKK